MLATVTDWLWSYVLIAALLAVGIRLTVSARFVQLRLFKEMFRGLSGGFSGTEKGLSSFQALVVSVAGRVGGGNIAGVAVAITLGGPCVDEAASTPANPVNAARMRYQSTQPTTTA